MKLEEMLEVNSSNIQRVGYRENTLYVAYLSGAIYSYANVPEQLFEDLKAAESKGKFINQNIKGHFDFQKEC